MIAHDRCLVPNAANVAPNHVFAEAFFRKMRGGTQSSLIGTSDGNFYVLKSANNPQGPNTLFNETFGSILSRHLGLPVPEWRPIEVSSNFIAENPGLYFLLAAGTRRPSTGLHFGSKFVIAPKDDEVYEVVPERWMQRVQRPDFFAGMLLLDIWAENVDRRQALFIECAASRALEVVFFDHGHMFRGPNGNKNLKDFHGCLYHHHNIYRRALESGAAHDWLCRIEKMTETTLWSLAERMPGEWYSRRLASDTIEFLMRNQQTLKQKVNDLTEELLRDGRSSSPAVDGENERSRYM